jgi:hypothetical protein
MNETKLNISNVFSHHPPKDNQSGRYEVLRAQAKHLALMINLHCPDSREKSLAITKLREASMWANASIACNE